MESWIQIPRLAASSSSEGPKDRPSAPSPPGIQEPQLPPLLPPPPPRTPTRSLALRFRLLSQSFLFWPPTKHRVSGGKA